MTVSWRVRRLAGLGLAVAGRAWLLVFWRVDLRWSMPRARGADAVEAVREQFRSRRVGIDEWYEAQRARWSSPAGASSYRVWRRSRRRRAMDLSEPWTLDDRQALVGDPITRSTHEPWDGTQSGRPYPAPDFSVPEGVRPEDWRHGRWVEPDFTRPEGTRSE